MTGRSGMWAGIVLVGLGLAGVLFGPGLAGAVGRSTGPYAMMSRLFGGGNRSGSDYGYGGMMGGSGYGGMMGGDFGGANSTVSSDVAGKMGNAVPQAASIDRAQNRIVFTGTDVRLDVEGSPRGQKDETFRVAGMVNPTIVVPKGADVHVDFVNADPDMQHNFVVTPAAPPFAYMTMMQIPLAFPGAATSVLDAPSGNEMNAMGVSFTASVNGTYTYLCTVPGHAENGMHGTFIVE